MSQWYLGWADYVVFSVVLLISAGIGVFYGCTGGKQKTTAEFLMANRQMTVLPVALSLLASFMSAVTLLGTPAEVYTYGTEYWIIWVGYCFMIPVSAHVFHPVFFNLGITSVFEYLEMRFSKGLRLYACILFIIQTVLYMAIVLYAPALALNAVTGLNRWLSVFSIGIVCIFYTTIGGMKAVMWTDVFQLCMMFAGLIAVLVRGSIDAGGFSNVWNANIDPGQRVEFLNWSPNPLVRHTVWSLSFGGCFTWLAIYAINQSQVQRVLSVPKLYQAQIAMWINLPGLTALLTLTGLCGMVMYYEYQNCDPLKSGRIIAKDQLLPLYVMDRFHDMPGLPGLFTACIFSGALSTLSSGFNSLAAVTLEDFVRRLCFPNLSESRATLASKLLALSFGIICVALTLVAEQLGGVLQAALALFGMIGGPVLGLFTLGMIFPFCNYVGAYVGLTVSLLLTLLLGIGANVYKPYSPTKPVSTSMCPGNNDTLFNETRTSDTSMWTEDVSTAASPYVPQYLPGYFRFYEISYMYYSLFAVLVVIILGLSVSLLVDLCKRRKTSWTTVNPELITPFMRRLFKSIGRDYNGGSDQIREQNGKPEKFADMESMTYTNGKLRGKEVSNGFVNESMIMESTHF